MRRRESRRLLTGVAFADDAVLGGEQTGKPGRGSENKAPFMVAVELDHDGYPRHVRFDAIANDQGETFSAWATSALHLNAGLVYGWPRQLQRRRRPSRDHRRRA